MKTNKETIAFRHEQVDIYKISVGCCVCGYNKHPSALCFDHLPDHEKAEVTKNGCSKRTCAGGMYRLYDKHHSVNDLISEIKKCRVLCSNCHMEITHKKNLRTPDNIVNQLTLQELEEQLTTFDKDVQC
jgi:uncharacterized protein YdcH (DUF465 family)